MAMVEVQDAKSRAGKDSPVQSTAAAIIKNTHNVFVRETAVSN